MQESNALPSLQNRLTLLALAIVCCLICTLLSAANLIFEDSFDEQPDWHSGLLVNDTGAYLNDQLYNGVHPATRIDMYQYDHLGHTIPVGWTSVRQGEQYFSPRNGYPDAHENIEILAKHADKARDGKGKSIVFWRESHQENRWEWNSDGILMKRLPDHLNELYVEFWITFDNNTTVNSWELTTANDPDASKVFRVFHLMPGYSEYGYHEGTGATPSYSYGWHANQWGVRNGLHVKQGQGSGLKWADGDLAGFGEGGGSRSYIAHIDGHGIDGGTEWPLDLTHGSTIDQTGFSLIQHNQIFGQQSQWVKMAMYLKMNSAAGVPDGELIQWLNGRRLITASGIPWVKEQITTDMPTWNRIAWGGNDFFHSYPIKDAREEWYAIDDIKIYDGIPLHADKDISIIVPPQAPSDFSARKIDAR